MISLSKEQVVFIHSELIRRTGGLDGVRDESLLDSALMAPFQTFAGSNYIRQLERKQLVIVSSL